ncbi:MAG TPA: metabolite traffic protein EboE [Verrucomicrobiae bacterium]|nr:metabolite traffic protein EboE [Verrucomicrobiae bacterium]
MKLNHNLHLAYSTNIHRGRTWGETLDTLERHTLAVREKVCPGGWFGIGLRLSAEAARELADRKTLAGFQRWLDKNSCYVFTINGFPYGQFHGMGVKEKVYLPDWTSPERLDYTNLLFDLLSELLPPGMAGSVSTLPGSFKDFIKTGAQEEAIRQNIWSCVEHVSAVSARSKRGMHLGLEPEPLCLWENSAETILLFERLRADRKNDSRLDEFLGVTYDCCHFAVEFEEPQAALAAFGEAGIKISKIHLSSALKAAATSEARGALRKFADDVYLHQVVARERDGQKRFFRDLPEAMDDGSMLTVQNSPRAEWRIHFHVPLHAPAAPPLENTNDHLMGVLEVLGGQPALCSHLEMETYTWEVLPAELKSSSVVDQLAAEYHWTLARLREFNL